MPGEIKNLYCNYMFLIALYINAWRGFNIFLTQFTPPSLGASACGLSAWASPKIRSFESTA
jgi:hypothetical protein